MNKNTNELRKKRLQISPGDIERIRQDRRPQEIACPQCTGGMMKAKQHFKTVSICFQCGHIEEGQQ